ncbi:MAG: hypothetical protein LBU65_09335 [Planctomycetaceae bacterium]|jgi:hypothetical protein|nr:hypothetical protein [Planctomycetaceae bacterium]
MIAYRLLVVMLSIVSVFLYAERDANSDMSDENQTEQVARLNIKASFITAMISDGDGGVFVGTEDYGVYHYDSVGNSKQFTHKDGLGDDNAYALAIDKVGGFGSGILILVFQFSMVSVGKILSLSCRLSSSMRPAVKIVVSGVSNSNDSIQRGIEKNFSIGSDGGGKSSRQITFRNTITRNATPVIASTIG